MCEYVADLQRAGKRVFVNRRYRLLSIVSFLTFATLYAFVLPATYTGGRVGMVSIQFLTPVLALFSVVMAGLIALIIPFTVYAAVVDTSAGTMNTAGGFVSSVLPPLLCCSPFLPILAATFAGVFPAVFGISGFIQGFFATYEIEILAAATLLLACSVHRSARVVTGCRC